MSAMTEVNSPLYAEACGRGNQLVASHGGHMAKDPVTDEIIDDISVSNRGVFPSASAIMASTRIERSKAVTVEGWNSPNRGISGSHSSHTRPMGIQNTIS